MPRRSIGDWHGWARVDDGLLTRAYCFVGDRGEVKVARRWGLCPLDIPDEPVTGTGIYGLPPAVPPRRDV
jgi:hypothetical protein